MPASKLSAASGKAAAAASAPASPTSSPHQALLLQQPITPAPRRSHSIAATTTTTPLNQVARSQPGTVPPSTPPSQVAPPRPATPPSAGRYEVAAELPRSASPSGSVFDSPRHDEGEEKAEREEMEEEEEAAEPRHPLAPLPLPLRFGAPSSPIQPSSSPPASPTQQQQQQQQQPTPSQRATSSASSPMQRSTSFQFSRTTSASSPPPASPDRSMSMSSLVEWSSGRGRERQLGRRRSSAAHAPFDVFEDPEPPRSPSPATRRRRAGWEMYMEPASDKENTSPPNGLDADGDDDLFA
ncbi:uncharacterized protein K452DRAFT_300920 [Aplosporella prunicola CBS 121167]|uniref:Uncharacterized protein n=1 Tax=Aplosporella prunicola CBS 121167 TaxID=1176127 RepID=A0A6A6B6G6_9PEZI|nr:uncharacterized protein K452DRAFT_300920 [Aplosporella prunicola CBS 121167]KAF2138865.1 hypothetical protein K452DRAFT_300920 [Aplosporella prunicola CBS 121167]